MVDILLSSFLVYQYWLLFGVCVFAAFGFPLPATAILIAWWALYAQGYFDMVYLFLAGFLGCILGDFLWYWLSYVYGKGLFIRIGLSRFIDIEKILEKHGSVFRKRSIICIFLSRWLVTGLGPTVNIIAGLTKVRPLLFASTDILGEWVYILLYIGIGYSFGSQWQVILDIIETFSSMILSFSLLFITFYFFWKHYRKREA